MKRTPLFEAHRRLGAKLVEFGGWEMPVQYTSIVQEHLAVRNAAGLFDISHMGEVSVSGASGADFLNRTLTNDIRKLTVGQGQYTLLCNQRGGVVDDLYAYRVGPEEFLLVINASRTTEDVAWLERQWTAYQGKGGVRLENVSDRTGALAVQGPRVVSFIDQVFPGPFLDGTKVARATELKKNQAAKMRFEGLEGWICRTGYTGEDGFEIIVPGESLETVWNALLSVGEPHGLKPAGLGARDTLRTEVCYPLYGHELDEQTTPIEAGLGVFVSFDKGDFTGRESLLEQKTNGPRKKLIAFRMTGPSAPPRPHYPIWKAGPEAAAIGEVVSGTQSPSLNCGIGMGYVPPEHSAPETAVEIEIRSQRRPAVIVRKPIYRKQ